VCIYIYDVLLDGVRTKLIMGVMGDTFVIAVNQMFDFT
jgi:hypothetical protein